MIDRVRHTLMSVAVLCCALWSSASVREIANLNFGWRFEYGDVPGAESRTYDDSEWTTVDLPHDFQISQQWIEPSADERPDMDNSVANVKSRLSARGFKEMGTGWYRRLLEADPSWQGRRVLLDFGGIMLTGDVYFNGEYVGGTDYGYLGFEVDVTGLVDYDNPNVIAVRADTGKPENSRWYTGGGLNRGVDVVVTDPDMYFMRHPLYVTTPVVTREKASVRLQAEIAALKFKGTELTVNTVITDADGDTVYDRTVSVPFDRRMRTNEYLVDSITVDNPRLWDLDTPHIYNVEMSLLSPDGDVVDRVTDTFGIRSIEYSPDFGFRLNGRKVLFKGLSGHNTYGAVGAAAYPRAVGKQMELLKDFGFNEIRCAHNPYSEEMLDLCDRHGILVVDELYDKWLTQYAGGRTDWMSLWPKDIPEWVKRDRNHPSVVLWSLGNELQTLWNIPFADWGVTPYRLQKTLLNRYDTTRPVTVAMHPRGRSLLTDSLPAPLALETDIASYNFRYMYFPGDSRRFPDMIFFQSEANTANMGPNYFDMDLDRVVGLSYWGMIDYLGESTGWPAKGWTQGVFDISLEPKPMAYFLRSFFKPEEPTVHIGIAERTEDDLTWNDVNISLEELTDHWNRRKGSRLRLYTFTNADEVELRLNGRVIGRKTNDTVHSIHRNRILWENVEYEPGVLEALAYNHGMDSPVAHHRIETAGSPAKLDVKSDNPGWKADGIDLCHVRIVAVDSKGNIVPDAETPLRFSVDGPAEIVGVINGDMNSEELTVGNTRRLYRGHAAVILRSTRDIGPVTLTVTSPDGQKTIHKMQTK